MKNLYLLTVLLLLSTLSFSDSKITRGPNIGEIYFIGPTHTGLGLYYSTDFGQTAICVDSTFTTSIMSICADKTEGGVYYVTMGEGLYFSDDFGNINTWELRSGGIKIQINSGLQDGYIYSSFSKHSENYGFDFISHNYNGFFGSKLDVEIDNENDIGYTVVNKYNVLDSIFLLISYDNFENFELQQSLEMSSGYGIRISRGFENGEIFLYNKHEGRLLISQDYGFNWIETNLFNTSLEVYDIIGGRIDKEIYVFYKHVNMMWQNAHIYIYHSMDYGVTFEVFHPFAKGNEPVLANFSTNSKEVFLTSEIEFNNFSIGNIQEYQWDFQNNGIVDSYEETPTYIYQDTGWYSVKLSVVGPDSTNSFTKENYIHIKDTTTSIQTNNLKSFNVYPNPVVSELMIDLPENQTNLKLSIYNSFGKKEFEREFSQKNLIIDFSNYKAGIYLLNIKDQINSICFKIIKN